MNFGNALEAIKLGVKVTRDGWNGKGLWIELQVPDEYSKMTKPYFYICSEAGDKVPWVPSVGDCLGDDWRGII